LEEVEIKNYGRGGVASEATLQLLLDATRSNSASASAAARQQQRIQENYNKTQKEGAGIFKKTADAAKGLAKEFATGGDRVSDFSKHILGTNSSLQSLIDYADGAVDQFRSLSSVGAGFNNSIFDMIKTAGTAGMRLDEFYRVVQENSETLRMLGGSVTRGAKEFADLSKSVRAGDLGQRLFDLGFTMSDVNDGMLTYISNQALQGRLERMSQAQLIKGSQEYLTEIDALAKATGLSRDALMDQTNDLQQNATFQSLMARASEEGADSLSKNMAVAAQMLPGFADDLVQISRGTGGLTDLGKALNQVDGGQAFIDLMMNAGNLEPDAFIRQMSALGPQVANSITSQFSPEQMRLLEGTPLGALFDTLVGFRRMGNMDADAMVAEQSRSDRITSLLANFESAIQRFRSEIIDKLLESEFGTKIGELGTALADAASAMFGETVSGTDGPVGKMSGAFGTAFNNLFGPEGKLTMAVAWATNLVNDMTSSEQPFTVFKDRVGELGTRLKNWFLDMFLGPINDEMGMSREGGLLGTIKNGFVSLMEDAKSLIFSTLGWDGEKTVWQNIQDAIGLEQGATSIGQQILSKAVEGIQDFFNGPMGEDLKNTIGGYFQYVMDYLVQLIAQIPGSSLLGIDHDQIASDVAERIISGQGPVTSAGFKTMLEQLPENQYSAMDLKSMIPEGSLFSENAPMLTNMVGWGIDRGIAMQNLMRQAGDMSEADLIANFGPDYKEKLAQFFQTTTRRVGTLKATGKTTEPKDTVAKIHQGERVLNPSEASAVNDLPGAINQLNTLTAQIRDLMTVSVQHQEKTARGIRKLGTDMMA